MSMLLSPMRQAHARIISHSGRFIIQKRGIFILSTPLSPELTIQYSTPKPKFSSEIPAYFILKDILLSAALGKLRRRHPNATSSFEHNFATVFPVAMNGAWRNTSVPLITIEEAQRREAERRRNHALLSVTHFLSQEV